MILGLTGGWDVERPPRLNACCARVCSLDSDAIIRTAVLTDRQVLERSGFHFGADVLTEAGEVDRGRLARRIFPDRRRFGGWRTWFIRGSSSIGGWHSPANGRNRWVVEVPLLFEKASRIGLISPSALPLIQRYSLPGWSSVEFLPARRQRISKQLPLTQKIKLVDLFA